MQTCHSKFHNFLDLLAGVVFILDSLVDDNPDCDRNKDGDPSVRFSQEQVVHHDDTRGVIDMKPEISKCSLLIKE